MAFLFDRVFSPAHRRGGLGKRGSLERLFVDGCRGGNVAERGRGKSPVPLSPINGGIKYLKKNLSLTSLPHRFAGIRMGVVGGRNGSSWGNSTPVERFNES